MIPTQVPRRRNRRGPLVQIPDGLRHTGDAPKYLRLYRHLRDGIVSGALPPGHRLPASRTLAEDLQVSRNTVESALDQLRAEGFIVRAVGRGTQVSPSLARALRTPRTLRSGHRGPATAPPPRGREALSERGREVLGANHLIASTAGFTFAPCVPDPATIPVEPWRQILARRSRRWSGVEALPPDPAGYRALREAIATYLVSSRGVRCDWTQVQVLASVQQGITLLTRLLLDPGDAVWLEEPGYPGARTAFAAGNARIVPVPVDAEGLDVQAGERLAPRARLAYVTPSHQYPLGFTLSLERRASLLEWAERRDAWIIEDDYDSEFRYIGRPLASIQGLDPAGRVIYAGTFGKVLFPSIRLAYLVLPTGLLDAFASAQDVTGGGPPTFLQAAVAEFMDSGQFAGHLRKLRDLFRERRAALLDAARARLGGAITLGPADTGLHVAAHLGDARDDRALSARAARARLDLPALSRYYAGSPASSGLLIHYAGSPPRMIQDGVAALAELLEDSRA